MKTLYNLILFVLFFMIISCEKNKDLIKEVKFGSITKEVFIDDFFNKKLITNPKRDFNSLDTISYDFIFNDKKGALILKLKANPSRYNFGDLRRIDLQINDPLLDFVNNIPDSVFEEKYNRILNFYNNQFGNPDTLISSNSYGFYKPINTKYFKWQYNNIDILLNNFEKKSSIETNISYRIKKYDERISKIKDSIERNQSIKNLIQNGVVRCSWEDIDYYNKKFKINVSDFSRIDWYDERNISAIRFDIVFKDDFNKEILREKDFTLEFNTELEPNKLSYFYEDNFQNYYVKYNISSKNGRKVEKLRQYSKNYNVVGITDIKAVVMNNGDVIKN